MIPKLIKTDDDYEATLERVKALMDAGPNTPDGDELELLTTLVELYEKKRFPDDLPDPIEAVRFRMEQAGLKQQDLVPYFGSRSKVSEVLHGKRALSLRMIRAIHKGLGIPAEVLLQERSATPAPFTRRMQMAKSRKPQPRRSEPANVLTLLDGVTEEHLKQLGAAIAATEKTLGDHEDRLAELRGLHAAVDIRLHGIPRKAYKRAEDGSWKVTCTENLQAKT